MNTQTAKFVPPNELDIYKSYALWSAYQSKLTSFYANVPAYHQLSSMPVLIRSPSSYSSSSECTIEQIQQFNRESPNSLRDFKLICEHCGSVYTSRKRLQNHYEKCIMLHPHLDELISCGVCKRTFKTNTGYTNHMLRFHGETVEEMREPKTVIDVEEDDVVMAEEKEVAKGVETSPMAKNKSIFHSIDMLARSDSNGRH